MIYNRIPLYYTFGNHMHWADMEWLWGYDVLPGSVRDMLRFCEETGAKGNINFDAIGYEKMAVEAPDALAELRHAIQCGQIEVVGASYGQPYGLFHGGESNVRQRVYGVRSVMRLLGSRPRTFWEEEFDFFPQLPQILQGVGFEYASLFFQWTWHTPIVPTEETPAIWWEGLDGSRLLTAPRNALNLHQWPEDFQGLLDSPKLREMKMPLILQWLELMPSPDWMCRSEVMLPPMRALLADPRFEVKPVTLSEFLELAREHAALRRYTLDDVFHGTSLGKNGDRLRRFSREGEQKLLAAESLSATIGFFGRPYPSWDAYPTWELEEAWRELLSAQHHDNDECEGLCGFIGVASYERSKRLAANITQRTMKSLAKRLSNDLVFNPLGWQRDVTLTNPTDGTRFVMRDLPPLGYRVITDADRANEVSPIEETETDATVTLKRGALSVTVDRARGVIMQITSDEFSTGALRKDVPLAQLEMACSSQAEHFDHVHTRVADGAISVHREGRNVSARVVVSITLAPELSAVDIRYRILSLFRPDGGMNAALHTKLAVNFPHKLIHDHPYGVSEIKAEGKTYLKKYPTGDWMTSPQWFEEVRNPFTALQFLDFDDGERGLLVLHDGSQAFMRDGDVVKHVLSMYDPWDEDSFYGGLDTRIRVILHGQLTHVQRWKLAQEFTRPALTSFTTEDTQKERSALPSEFGSVWCDAPNVVVTAFYREFESDGVKYPYVMRLVEFNGEATTARLRLPGRIASARKTNLLGEAMMQLTATTAESPIEGLREWSEVAVEMRPHEIATLYLDLELGRKVTRDLDTHRNVWATIHRVDERETSQ